MKSLIQYKKRLIAIQFIGFVLTLAYLIWGSIYGYFFEHLLKIWICFICVAIPPLVVLFLIKDVKYNIATNGLSALTLLFTCSLILAPIGLRFAKLNGSDLGQSINVAFLILVPLSLVLCYLYWKKMIVPIKLIDAQDLIEEEPSVFLSYNHQDAAVALKIKEKLEKADIDVTIDREDMLAGENITDFIENSIYKSTVTISLVSNKSLTSAWVAMETIDSFLKAKYAPNKTLIACYLDEDFFDTNFTINAIESIDAQIKKNQKLLTEYHKKMLDTRDLNDQNSRLMVLRNNLDAIVNRFRESLCLDVRAHVFETSMALLIKTIKGDQN